MMDVTFNIDNGYAQHCAVTMVSLFRNNTRNKLHVHVVTTSLSDKNKAKLQGVASDYGQFISFYDVDLEKVENLPNLKGHHVSAAAYLRLFIDKLLPITVDKVLYLDCDLVVRHDISELWNTDIYSYALAAVQDAPNSGAQERLGYSSAYRYFNSGVMLVNLAYWRAHNANEKLTSYIQHNAAIIVHHDQDVLNAVFHDQVLFLPLKWNMLKCFFRSKKPRIHQEHLPVLEKSKSDPYIVHFTGSLKPWDCWINLSFQDEYYTYLQLTPWKGYRPAASAIIKKRGLILGLLSVLGVERLMYKIKEIF